MPKPKDEVLALRAMQNAPPDGDTGVIIKNSGADFDIERDFFGPGAIDIFFHPCNKLPPEIDGKEPIQSFDPKLKGQVLRWRCRYGDHEHQFEGRRIITKSGKVRRILKRKVLDLRKGRARIFVDRHPAR